MVIRWSPDTCDCVIDMDENGKYVGTVAVCKEPAHKAAAGDGGHLAVVIGHQAPYNDLGKYSSDKSGDMQPWDFDERSEKIRDVQAKASAAKEAERDRIRALGA
jgi:hypothetical protein